ncbi:MAG: tRNA (adenosine(37)-N6)-threonylcarbamoyltransferase complex dimerization subunit type 1 TsaB [Gemmatimonadaceae bacterium]|nr:tRNA (adenosine(37)-N6)-threonylcarbamoyltransferase complex dimerization subunit type 1 TsaB [Gemmatimonadaceae bacterium]
MTDVVRWPGATLVLDGSLGPITLARLQDELLLGVRVAARTAAPAMVGPAEQLLPLVQELMALAPAAAVARVVVGSGPGSFTGLRAAAAFAKGIAHGGGVPLLAVPSLALLAADAVERGAVDDRDEVVASIDALRGERFVQHFGVDRATGRVTRVGPVARVAAAPPDPRWVGPGCVVHAAPVAGAVRPAQLLAEAVSIAQWEPAYGRLAEAQVQWEAGQLGAPAAP